MLTAKELSNGCKVIRCDTCKTPVSSAVPGDIALRVAIIMCPDCLARIPDDLVERFLASASWPAPTVTYPKVTKPSWNYDAEKYPNFENECGSIPTKGE